MFRTTIAGMTLLLAATVAGQEQAHIDVLTSDAPIAAKAAACRELKTAGTAASVAALAPLLNLPELSHDARIALEAMPYPEASAALRDAVQTTRGVLRAGVLDSIGERRDPDAVGAAAAALDDADLQVVASAALALGKIGTREAAQRLERAFAKAAGDRRAAIGDGRLRCAAGLMQAGRTDEAAAVFRRLAAPEEPASLRGPALLGLVQAAGGGATETVGALLADADPVRRAAAAASLPYLPAATLHTVAADWQRLPPDSRFALVAALRTRADPAFARVAIEAARSDDPPVAEAGIEAVGVLAGANGVEVLLPIAVAGGPLADPAWRALEWLRGAEVDARLAAALPLQPTAEPRVRLIRALAARGASGSVPGLLDQAAAGEGDVRAAAIDAIVGLARPEHVPAIVTLMHRVPRGAQRDALEKAVMLALDGIADPDRRTAAVLAGVDLQSDAQRIEFLPLLGRIGGGRALALAQEALAGSDAAMYEAGVRALANWPDAGVIEQLAGLAQNAREHHQRLWALRAMIRVSTLPGPLPDDRKLALLRQAMDMATRDEERALALQRAGAVRTVDSLHFVAGYLDHPALAPHACAAVVELAHHQELRGSAPGAFASALRKVLGAGSDAGVSDRARRYLEALGDAGRQ